MNFLCDKCKQKYHVADEKLAGRAVTRFRCKKCDNVIELHAPAPQSAGGPGGATASTPATASSPPVARAVTAAMPVARAGAAGLRPRPTTSTGPAYGTTPPRQATMPPTSTPRAATSAAAPSENGWYAGIRDVPVGPLSRKDLAARVASGDVAPDTLVWREGLDDWRPLQAIAELSDMLRPSGVPGLASRPLTRPQPVASGRPASRPSIGDDDDEATRVSSLDPALASLVARSIRPESAPSKPSSVAEKSASEKSGADRPLPGAPTLSPLARPTPAVRSAPPGTPAPAARSTEPAARSTEPAVEQSSVFPPPAKAAPEPVVSRAARPSADAWRASNSSSAPLPERSQPGAAVAQSGPVEKAHAERAPTPEPAPAPVAKPPTMDELSAALPADLFPATAQGDRPASPRPPVAVASQAAPTKPASHGLPASAWILMAGVLVAGIGGGVYIGNLRAPTQPEPPRPLHTVPAPEPSRDAALAATDDAAVPYAVRASAARVAEVAVGLRDSPVVQACWQATLQQNAALRTSTVTLDVSVEATGRYARLSVTGSPDPRFDECLRARVASIAPVPAGEAAQARAVVTLNVNR
jgi:predicted Zn finger-like uncharacterized protein